MTIAKVLLIESERAGSPSFAAPLAKKGYDVLRAHKVSQALKLAEEQRPDIVVLDAASMRTSGKRMFRRLRVVLKDIPAILLSPAGSRSTVNGAGAAGLIHPFTVRKLTNRIGRMLPSNEGDILQYGPLKLDLARRRVAFGDRLTRLTPRATALLKIFLENPGRLLTREEIMREVWSTSYMGDTRTLDVHISWLRKAIEPDPTQPRYLKTFRSLGYRLDLPPT